MITTQGGYTTGDDPPGVPLIGYDQKISAIAATSEASGFPASNLLNPGTHLFWKATAATVQSLAMVTSGECDYLAIAKHNLLSSGARLGLFASASATTLTLLLHFDGADGSTLFVDSSGNDFGVHAFATGGQIDTAQSKFGGSSLLCNTPANGRAHATWSAVGNSDYTLDFWVNFYGLPGVVQTIFDSRDVALTTNGFVVYLSSTNRLIFYANGADRITGTTALTNATWYHVAVTRSGSSTKLFLN